MDFPLKIVILGKILFLNVFYKTDRKDVIKTLLDLRKFAEMNGEYAKRKD